MIGYLRAVVAGMRAHQQRTEVIGNNLANLETAGFKRSSAEFEDLFYRMVQPVALQPSTGRPIGSGAVVASVTRDFDQGALRLSDSPLHLAIEGAGFFQIQLADGQVAYTRDGTFRIDEAGRIVTADGLPVAPGIALPAGVRNLTVSRDGVVQGETGDPATVQEFGQIQVATFTNPQGLLATGGNRFLATEVSGPATVGPPASGDAGAVASGFLENGNVELGVEMSSLVAAQRAYSMNARAFQALDEMLGMAANLRR